MKYGLCFTCFCAFVTAISRLHHGDTIGFILFAAMGIFQAYVVYRYDEWNR